MYLTPFVICHFVLCHVFDTVIKKSRDPQRNESDTFFPLVVSRALSVGVSRCVILLAHSYDRIFLLLNSANFAGVPIPHNIIINGIFLYARTII